MGNHYCHFYEGVEDLAAAVVPFMVAGIRRNEQCLWVTTEPFGVEAATEALAALVPDLQSRMAGGQVEIIAHDQWYTAGGGFDAHAVINGWLERERRALEQGYAGLRITGNTLWLETPEQFADFSAYEAALHEALQGQRITCLCSYCLNRGSGRDLLNVVRNHDFAAIRSNGQWEIIESASLRIAKNELSERLSRKERLLTEIHHRVKNNLQIVSSLLTLKAHEFGPAAQQPLDDILGRIGAMGLVHQMLYEQDYGGLVNLPLYLKRLVEQLSNAYSCHDRIALAVEVPHGLLPLLDLDTAIPVGIAITEAITNAIKHAFPDGRRGTVTVAVEEAEHGVRVMVRDDGRGCDFTKAAGNPGAGLALIQGLASQVGGGVEFIGGRHGATLALTVPCTLSPPGRYRPQTH
ncbi:MAG: sensor histidine kinase [Bacteroidales bacterium]